MQPAVLDTNVALDLLLFADPAAAPLAQALAQGRLRWLATAAMREELARVLAYPCLAARVATGGAALLARFDALVQPVAAAPPAAVLCRDGDDQKFVDLAVEHAALLLSRDAEVLRLRRRLAPLGVQVAPAYGAASPGAGLPQWQSRPLSAIR